MEQVNPQQQLLLTEEMVEETHIRERIHATVARIIHTINGSSSGVPRIVNWFFFGSTVKCTRGHTPLDIDVLLEVECMDQSLSPSIFLTRYSDALQQLMTETGDRMRLTYPTLALIDRDLLFTVDLLFSVGVDGDPAAAFGYDTGSGKACESLRDAQHHYYRIASNDGAHWVHTCPPLDCALMRPYTHSLCVFVRQVKRVLMVNGIDINGFLIESLALHVKPRNAGLLLKELIAGMRRGCIENMYQPGRNLITDPSTASLYAVLIERIYPLFYAMVNSI